MTAQTIAPLIPPRPRPGAREHGKAAVVRRLPVAVAPEVPAPARTCRMGSGGWTPRAGWRTGP